MVCDTGGSVFSRVPSPETRPASSAARRKAADTHSTRLATVRNLQGPPLTLSRTIILPASNPSQRRPRGT
jgi:hypothetical protein